MPDGVPVFLLFLVPTGQHVLNKVNLFERCHAEAATLQCCAWHKPSTATACVPPAVQLAGSCMSPANLCASCCMRSRPKNPRNHRVLPTHRHADQHSTTAEHHPPHQTHMQTNLAPCRNTIHHNPTDADSHTSVVLHLVRGSTATACTAKVRLTGSFITQVSADASACMQSGLQLN